MLWYGMVWYMVYGLWYGAAVWHRFSALLGFRSSLQSSWQHSMSVCTHSSSRSMAQSLRDLYGQQQQQQQQGDKEGEAEQEDRKEEGGHQRGGEAASLPMCVSSSASACPSLSSSPSSSSCGDRRVDRGVDLLVVVDDQFHPGLTSVLQQLQSALSPLGGGEGGGGGVVIRYMVAFDSINVVPYRSLVSKFDWANCDRQAAMAIARSAFSDVVKNTCGSPATTLKV